MDAVKFIEERNRMYKSGAATPSIGLEDDYDPVSAVEIVEKWAAAHPRKTRQSVFLEQYPGAMIDKEGLLSVCPQYLDRNFKCRRDDGCGDCRREFCMQEVK